MAPVEDTTKLKLLPNFSDGELVAMITMVSDNKYQLSIRYPFVPHIVDP